MKFRQAAVTVLIALVPLAAYAADVPRDPLAAADAFAAALERGDENAARALLAPDVLVYESGGQESSLDEYAAHHLAADIKFLAATESQRLGRRHGTSGDLAWVATRSRITGKYNGKPVDLFSTESLVLKREAGAWRIVHIQWSSQPAPSK